MWKSSYSPLLNGEFLQVACTVPLLSLWASIKAHDIFINMV